MDPAGLVTAAATAIEGLDMTTAAVAALTITLGIYAYRKVSGMFGR
jgi:hypothetical protein